MATARLGATNGTILNPKSDILFLPDVVLGAGEAMRRREFITLIGGAAAAWPLTARAQQGEHLRRIGVLMGGSNDPLGQARAAALVQGLGEFNSHDGGNLRIDWRWAGGNPELYERYAAELIPLDPELLVVWGSPGVAALRRQNSTIPIVMVLVTDPVGQGFVESLARPGAPAQVAASFCSCCPFFGRQF